MPSGPPQTSDTLSYGLVYSIRAVRLNHAQMFRLSKMHAVTSKREQASAIISGTRRVFPEKVMRIDQRVFRLLILLSWIGLMISNSSSGSMLPFNYDKNKLGSNWTLVFNDEFIGTKLNTTNWAPYWFSDGNLNPGSSTRSYATNVTLDGHLNLRLRNATNGACLSSYAYGGAKRGFQFTYGYAEAKITIPKNGAVIAHWPAWWLDGLSWPKDGEIDIMEGLNGNAAWHYHYDAGGGLDSHPIGGSVNMSPGTHVYAVNWYQGHLDFYYDGKLVASATNASLSGGALISSSPMYLILDYDAGSGPLPSTMVVDYVRVFQSKLKPSVILNN